MRRLRVMLLVAALGIATTIGTAWAIAAWMPFESYPRQTAHYFVAGARPWSAFGRTSRGVHNIWWDQIDADSYTAPGQRLPEATWPSTPDSWVEYARGFHENARWLRRHGSGERMYDADVDRLRGGRSQVATLLRDTVPVRIVPSAGPCPRCGTRSSAPSRRTRRQLPASAAA